MKRLSPELIRAALIRACRTMAQMAVSLITVGQAIQSIDWVAVLSISATAGVISLLTSIAGGVPEAVTHGTLHVDPNSTENGSWKIEMPKGLSSATDLKTVTFTVNPNYTAPPKEADEDAA